MRLSQLLRDIDGWVKKRNAMTTILSRKDFISQAAA
jgi:hypothetical protein